MSAKREWRLEGRAARSVLRGAFALGERSIPVSDCLTLAIDRARAMLCAVLVRFDDDYLRVEEDPEHRVVVVTRKAKRFPSADDMEAAYMRVFRAPRIAASRWSLVLDSRAAPGSSDSATEERIRHLAAEAERRFALVVVLVASAAGILQGQRLQSGHDMRAAGPRGVKLGGGKTVLTRDPEYALELARAPR